MNESNNFNSWNNVNNVPDKSLRNEDCCERKRFIMLIRNTWWRWMFRKCSRCSCCWLRSDKRQDLVAYRFLYPVSRVLKVTCDRLRVENVIVSFPYFPGKEIVTPRLMWWRLEIGGNSRYVTVWFMCPPWFIASVTCMSRRLSQKEFGTIPNSYIVKSLYAIQIWLMFKYLIPYG